MLRKRDQAAATGGERRPLMNAPGGSPGTDSPEPLEQQGQALRQPSDALLDVPKSAGNSEADVILVVKSPYSKERRDNDTTLSKEKLLKMKEKIVVGRKAFEEMFIKFSDILEARFPSTLGKCRLALLEDLCSWLPKQGFTIHLFQSHNQKNVFIRVSIDPGIVEEQLAHKMQLRLHTTTELISALGIKQDSEGVDTAYMPYHHPSLRKFHEEKQVPVFQQYVGKHPRGSILRSADRIRIIYFHLNEVLKMDNCKNMDLLKGHYPVHDQNALSEFRTDWARFELLFLSWHQPVTRLRDYFGEPIAFYYAWLGFCCKGVGLLSIPAVAIWFSQVYYQYPLSHMMAIWCPILVVWDTAWSVLWQRKQNLYAECWDMKKQTFEDMEIRPRYRYQVRQSKVHQDEQEHFFPAWKRVGLKWLTWTLTIVSILFVVITVYLVYYSYKHWLDDIFGRLGYRVSRSMFTGLCMSLLNYGWKFIAAILVDWQNPRTMTEYRSRLWAKVMAFQAVNSYLSLMWLCYAQAFGHAEDANDDSVTDESRMHELQFYLVTTYLSLAFFDIGLSLFNKLSLTRKLERAERYAISLVHISTPSASMPRRCNMEKQVDLDDYVVELEILDSVDTVVTIGYILLFGVICPLLVVACLVAMMIKMRVTSWQLCSLYRRPFPWRASGLCKAQLEVLAVFAWLGMANSIALPLFNLKRFRQYSRPVLWCIFFAAEHALLILKFVISRCLSDVSGNQELMVKQRQRVLDEWRSNQGGYEEVVHIEKPPVRCRESDISRIDQHCEEWWRLQTPDTYPGLSVAVLPWLPSTSPDGGLEKQARFGVELHDPLGSNLI